jgi:N utilization substance protein A
MEKLTEAGITTVESLADMTPEELEAIPGIGPETVESISVAVNNYFSSLDSQEQSAEPVEAEYPSEPVLAEASDLPVEAEDAAEQAAEGEQAQTEEAAQTEEHHEQEPEGGSSEG